MSGEKDIVIKYFDGSLPELQKEAQGDVTMVLAVAMESKGRNPRTAKIVELSAVLLELDAESCTINRVAEEGHWFQDPEEESPFSEGFTEKTGITEEMVRGQSIDGRAFEDMVEAADVVIAFNAGFVRPILQEQFPSVEDAVFACVRNQIEWGVKGHDSRSFFHLTRDHLWYTDDQRTKAQVGAIIKLMSTEQSMKGEPAEYMKELVSRAQEPLLTIEAKVDQQQRYLMKKERFNWNPRERTHIRVMGTSTLERVRRSLDARGFTGELIERDRMPATERFK